MVDEARILIRRGDEPWRQPSVTAYTNELGLQRLLVETPRLVPGLGPVAVVDEFSVSAKATADVVGVEPSGAITVVECKLITNADIRRTVVGQILAYAAGLWRMPYSDFAERFARRASRPLLDVVAESAAEAGIEFNPDQFVHAVSTNLSLGLFRLCIAVDEITDELKAIVELLNRQTRAGFEVLLLELGFVADDDLSILLPHAYGLESAEVKRSENANPEKWTIDEVFTALQDLCSPEGVAAVRAVYSWADSRGATYWLGRGQYPTIGVYLVINGQNRSLFAIYADPSGPTAPRISLSFGAFSRSVDASTVEALVADLELTPELVAVAAAARSGAFKGYPTIPIGKLEETGVASALIAAFNRHIGPYIH